MSIGSNGYGLLLSELHQTVVNLLNNDGMTVFSRVLTRFCFLLNLRLDPEVGLSKTFRNGNLGFPPKLLHDELVVGVPSSDTHGSLNMLDWEVLVLEGECNGGKLIHVDHFGGSEVEGDVTVGKCQTKDTFDTVINECKGASLQAISPHFKVLSGGNSLPAKSSRSLFASSLPGTAGSIDVVEPSDANVNVKVASVGECHLFGVELLKTVHVLRTCRPGIGFDETGVGGIFLLGLVVDTGRGRVEKVLDLVATGGLEHVHGDGRVVKGEDGLIGDDESHAPHVCGEVVDLSASLAGLAGDFELAEIIKDKLIAKLVNFHELILLPVDDCHLVASFLKTLGNVRADEASTTADADLLAVSRWESKGCHRAGCFMCR